MVMQRKPTTWASTRSLPSLRKGPGNGEVADDPSPHQWPSAKWAKWAPGMIQLLVDQLESESHKLARAEMNWDEHIRNGHWPPSRQCRTCIGATARQRPHRRIASPASWSLAVDTIGPFKKAEDETSNHLKYVLVACLLVPVDDKGRPVLGPEQRQQELPDDSGDTLCPIHKGSEGLDDEQPDDDDEGYAGLFDWPEDGAEDEAPLPEASPQALQACEKDADGLTAAERECKVSGLRWKEIVFTEPIRRKTPAAAEQAVNKNILEIVELGFHITRIHSDSGSEFINDHMRRLANKYSLKQTCSAPEEHNSNGRIENVVQRLKGQVRAYLHAGKNAEVHLWPLAVRAASAAWRTQTLRGMGMAIPPVVPYGTATQVLSRTWLRRAAHQAWTLKAVPAVVLCPASLVKLGYVVRIGKRLSVVTKLFDGKDPPLRTELEHPGARIPEAHSIGPEGRIVAKAKRPDMSRVPGPSRRYRYKAPGPGRVPIVGKLHTQHPDDEEGTAASLAHKVPFCVQQAKDFVCASSYVKAQGPCNSLNSGKHLIFGAYSSVEGVGVSNYCKLRPGMCELLNAIARVECPGQSYYALVLSVGAQLHMSPQHCANTVISLQAPEVGGRMWCQQVGSNLTQSQAVALQDNNQDMVGVLQPVDKVVTLMPGQIGAVETWRGSKLRITLTVLHATPSSNFPKTVKHDLERHGFVVAGNYKGGDHPHNCPHKISEIQTSSFPFPPSVSQQAGPGEISEIQTSSFPFPPSVSQHAGPGEISEIQTSSFHFPPSVSQHAGPGESIREPQQEQFCRICESEESRNEQGRCRECGCMFGTELVSVQSTSDRAAAPQNQTQRTLKNGIDPNYKSGITYKQEVECLHKQNRAGHADQNPWQCSSLPYLPTAGVLLNCGACIKPTLRSEVVRFVERTVDLEAFCRDGSPWEEDGEEAEGQGLRPDEVEPYRWLNGSGSRVVVEYVLSGDECMDQGSAETGGQPADEAEIHNQLSMLEVRGHESAVCDSTERLRVIVDSAGPREVVWQDTHDVAAWLDERQLRLSNLHQDELQSWVNDNLPGSEEEKRQRLQIQKIWEDVEDLRWELRSLGTQQLADDMSQLVNLGERTQEEGQAVLQTRIVANAEVMAKCHLQYQSAMW